MVRRRRGTLRQFECSFRRTVRVCATLSRISRPTVIFTALVSLLKRCRITRTITWKLSMTVPIRQKLINFWKGKLLCFWSDDFSILYHISWSSFILSWSFVSICSINCQIIINIISTFKIVCAIEECEKLTRY